MTKKPDPSLDTFSVRPFDKLRTQPECRTECGVSKESGKRPARKVINLRTRAMQYLARREHSRAELRAKLQPHLHSDDEFDSPPAEDLDALLDDLAKRGWLSDERAAAQLVHAKRARFGSQRIAQELRQRGIDETLIAETLPELKDSELATAREVWRKKFGSLPQDQKEKAKQMRFLQSRGFSLDVVFKVLRTDDMED